MTMKLVATVSDSQLSARTEKILFMCCEREKRIKFVATENLSSLVPFSDNDHNKPKQSCDELVDSGEQTVTYVIEADSFILTASGSADFTSSAIIYIGTKKTAAKHRNIALFSLPEKHAN